MAKALRAINADRMTDVVKVSSLYRTPLRSEGIRAVLLSGAGKHFSAGADLEHLGSLRDAGDAVDGPVWARPSCSGRACVPARPPARAFSPWP